MRQHLPILPVLLTLAGAMVIPVASVWWRRGAWPIALVSGLAASAAAGAGLLEVVNRGPLRYTVAGWPPPWGIEVVLDHLGAFTATVIAGVGTLALITSAESVRRDGERSAVGFYTLGLVTLAGFIGIAVSGDLFNVFVFLEIAAIASYALVASGGGPALAAAFRYVILGTAGASFYLLGVGFLYALTGTLNMGDLGERVGAVPPSPLLVGGTLLLTLGLIVKMALFPLHGWLPDAYTYAPPAVAQLIAPLGTKVAAYILARVLLYVLHPNGPLTSALAWAGGLAIVAGGIMALRQRDARRLLAFSSVSQLGYIVLGMGLTNGPALTGAYLHIMNHALMKATLFGVVGAGLLANHGPAIEHLALRSHGPAAIGAVVAALSMVGVPPLGGFFSKWYLLEGALEAGEPVLVGSILAGSLLAAVYMYRFTETVWFPAESTPSSHGVSPLTLTIGLLTLAGALLAAGLGNEIIVARVLRPAATGAR
jgi:multicomponent Na+:H+ antiporter subunit D